MNALNTITKYIKDKALGDPVQERGTVFRREKRFATEKLRIALYKKNEKLNWVQEITYKTMLCPYIWLIVFFNVNLTGYVEKLKSNYLAFFEIAYLPELYSPTGKYRLSFTTRLTLKLLFGFRGTKLLSDTPPYEDIFRIDGFVARHRRRKVLKAPNCIASDSGNVISEEGFKAVLDTLSAYIARGYEKVGNRQLGYQMGFIAKLGNAHYASPA